MVTGTGYAASDFNAWGTFPVGVIFFLMCIGGCSGSTTGGMKVFRFAVLYQIARGRCCAYCSHRRSSGRSTTASRSRIRRRSRSSASLLFALSFAVPLLLSFLGLDYLTAMSGALSALANVGPGLGDLIGPAKNFAALPDTAKWLLSAGMLLGRLELSYCIAFSLPPSGGPEPALLRGGSMLGLIEKLFGADTAKPELRAGLPRTRRRPQHSSSRRRSATAISVRLNGRSSPAFSAGISTCRQVSPTGCSAAEGSGPRCCRSARLHTGW
ncbi:MAG: potassium transporter TrkG [Geminicoccaceae bacterium]